MSEARIVLASASPRRKALLVQLGLQVEVVAVGIEEAVRDEEKPSDYVARLANDKARYSRVAALCKIGCRSGSEPANVRYGSKGDVERLVPDVRFGSKPDISGLGILRPLSSGNQTLEA